MVLLFACWFALFGATRSYRIFENVDGCSAIQARFICLNSVTPQEKDRECVTHLCVDLKIDDCCLVRDKLDAMDQHERQLKEQSEAALVARQKAEQAASEAPKDAMDSHLHPGGSLSSERAPMEHPTERKYPAPSLQPAPHMHEDEDDNNEEIDLELEHELGGYDDEVEDEELYDEPAVEKVKATRDANGRIVMPPSTKRNKRSSKDRSSGSGKKSFGRKKTFSSGRSGRKRSSRASKGSKGSRGGSRGGSGGHGKKAKAKCCRCQDGFVYCAAGGKCGCSFQKGKENHGPPDEGDIKAPVGLCLTAPREHGSREACEGLYPY